MAVFQKTSKSGNPTPATKAATAIATGRRREGEEDERQREREDRQSRREKQALRLEAQGDESAGDRPDRTGGEDDPQVAAPPELVLRDDRAEHRPRADVGRVDERELDDDPPEPRPRAEAVPAFAKLTQEVLLGHRQVSRQPQTEQEDGTEEVGRRVEGERPPRADRGDEDAAGRCAEHLRRAPGQPE